MRLGRTLAPAAAPIGWEDFVSGLKGWVNGQSELVRFEREVNSFLGVSSSFYVSSGKAALTIALQSLKDLYPDKDEVLIPAFTCYSVPSAVVRAGLKVKLCDLGQDTLDFDFEQLGCMLADERLLCVIPGHLFGRAVDVERLKKMAAEWQVQIIEDAAQSFGGQVGDKKLGTLGDVGIFSLGRGKAISTVEGGIIVTNREDIALRIESRLSHLSQYAFNDSLKLAGYALALMWLLHPSLFWIPKLIPFLRLGETIYDPEFNIQKMSPFQAGLSRDWQLKLDKFQQNRNQVARQWFSIMQTLRQKHYYMCNNRAPDLIRFPWKVDSLNTREKILKESERLGLGIARTYPDSINGIPGLPGDFAGKQFPIAKDLAESILTLPIHPLLQQKDVEKIKRVITAAVREREEE